MFAHEISEPLDVHNVLCSGQLLFSVLFGQNVALCA